MSAAIRPSRHRPHCPACTCLHLPAPACTCRRGTGVGAAQVSARHRCRRGTRERSRREPIPQRNGETASFPHTARGIFDARNTRSLRAVTGQRMSYEHKI